MASDVCEYADSLACQLEEIEVLQSMYPGNGEMELDDPEVLKDTEGFLTGHRKALPGVISFRVELQVTAENSSEEVHAVDFICSLPHNYPKVAPDVFVTSDALCRQHQKQLNEALTAYVAELERGEVCITSVLMWIQENTGEYLQLSQSASADKTRTPDAKHHKCKKSGLSRLWIFSHHIYRKELLKKIPDSARELDLTGFVLPGKPGIICVEGYKENCDDYWHRLRYPNWKHISCKHREDVDLSPDCDPTEQVEVFRLFKGFEELAFEAHGDYGLRNDYHMDLGQFRQFLVDHDCDYMFHIFFGLQGKEAVKSQ